MSINNPAELLGMQRISEVVGDTLYKMRKYAAPGMSAAELDAYGGELLKAAGAKSAPQRTYNFPGFTCICLNHEVAHGIPSKEKILKEGDLINIDVSAELDGFWADNGGSFVLGNDVHQHQALVDASKNILHTAIHQIRTGIKIADIGAIIEKEAKKRGLTVIRNLAGHGVGRSLHEEPSEILNCYNRHNTQRFKKNSVVAIETFISTVSTQARETKDGWTLVGNKGGFVAQHEHTIVVTDDVPMILTMNNGIWN